MAKSWNNWSIDTDDEDISITGDSSSLDKVSITFSSGNVVDARTYIITYNDGQRCVSFRYYVSDTSSTCDCSSLVFHGTEEPDPQQHFLINVSAKNSTSQHIQFVAFQMIYTDATSDAINFGAGLEITAGQTVVENDIRLEQENEGKTINFIAVVYYQNGTNVQRSLDNDEWSCSSGGSQLHTGDTLNINFKR